MAMESDKTIRQRDKNEETNVEHRPTARGRPRLETPKASEVLSTLAVYLVVRNVSPKFTSAKGRYYSSSSRWWYRNDSRVYLVSFSRARQQSVYFVLER